MTKAYTDAVSWTDRALTPSTPLTIVTPDNDPKLVDRRGLPRFGTGELHFHGYFAESRSETEADEVDGRKQYCLFLLTDNSLACFELLKKFNRFKCLGGLSDKPRAQPRKISGYFSRYDAEYVVAQGVAVNYSKNEKNQFQIVGCERTPQENWVLEEFELMKNQYGVQGAVFVFVVFGLSIILILSFVPIFVFFGLDEYLKPWMKNLSRHFR
ncbi:MAG: hypothetical protein AAF829_11350 [Pseudomonadota bacterium]